MWFGNAVQSAIEQKEKNIQIVRNLADFNALTKSYIGQTISPENFDEGQVILVDDGLIDSCVAHLEFNETISALALTDNTVKVTLNYVEKPTVEKCSSSLSRPYHFYYLQTSKSLVFEEKIVQ